MNAVISSIKVAQKHQCKSIAIPAISSGIFGFPVGRCAEILFDVAETKSLFRMGELEEIRFTNIDDPTVGVFSAEFKKRFN